MPSVSSLESEFSGRIWRILPQTALHAALDPVISEEGRFHHSGQSALYASPTPKAAGRAVARHSSGRSAPLLAIPLILEARRILDLRDPAVVEALGLQGFEPSRPWLPERRAGLAASSWRASDAARDFGAQGMIYTARNAPHLWHLVLFRWNDGAGAVLRRDGLPQAALP